MIYVVNTSQVTLETTMNHKMYISNVQPDSVFNTKTYSCVEAKNIIKDRVYYKKNADNKNFDLDEVHDFCDGCKYQDYCYRNEDQINAWFWFLGIFISEGHIDNSGAIRIATHKERIKQKLEEILPLLNLRYIEYNGDPDCWYIKSNGRYTTSAAKWLKNNCYTVEAKQGGFIAGYKCLPEPIWQSGMDQCRLLIDGLCLGDGYKDRRRENSMEFYTSSRRLADDFQRLCLHAGYACNVVLKKGKGELLSIKGVNTKRNFDAYRMCVMKHINSLCPSVTKVDVREYKGKVYCIEVPNHVFYIRNIGKKQNGVWTGNSSRAG
jgi:hypothetical protein